MPRPRGVTAKSREAHLQVALRLPSPLNGERGRVRGGNSVALPLNNAKAFKRATHPMSIPPQKRNASPSLRRGGINGRSSEDEPHPSDTHYISPYRKTAAGFASPSLLRSASCPIRCGESVGWPSCS